MNSKKICIIDYGSGNVGSVFNIVSKYHPAIISNEKKDIANASHLILPGVGSFGSAMEKIMNVLPIEFMMGEILKGKPFLGICVGMQVLAQTGFEFGQFSGLGLFPANVSQLDSKLLRLPHIGWNNLEILKNSLLLKNINTENDFYFLHSYVFGSISDQFTIATSTYGSTFTAVIEKDNLFGVQFHPEKSQKSGGILLNNFFAVE
jgi:glutamine amidotransferase